MKYYIHTNLTSQQKDDIISVNKAMKLLAKLAQTELLSFFKPTNMKI